MNFKAFRQWVILLLMIVVGVTVFFLYNINIDSKSNRQPAQIISSVANSTSIDSLQPGEWYEIPNSKIRQSLPSPIPVGNPSNITNAWNGGFFDSTRNRYVVMGGGHADYAGNEMYGFDVNSLTWSRFWGPTPNAQIPTSTGTYEVYDDGNPGSRHTYGGLVYLPNIDKYFVHGGSLYYSGNGSSKVWLFNPAGGTWSQGTTPSGNCTVNELVNQAAYDPGTGKVLVHLYNHLCEYDPIGNAWTKRGDGGAGFSFGNHAAVYDYDHKYYCFITNGVWCYNLNDSSTATPLTRVTTSGDIGIESAGVAGADYDPVSKKIVAWVGGTSVYTLDITTSRWTKLSAATGNTVTPTSPTSNGTFGRWRYVPSKNAFIVVNSIDDNVYMYKLSSGSGVPQVTDVTPPSTPGGLVASNLAQTTLTLNWNVSIDNVGVTGYKVFKAGIQIGTPTTNSFAVTGLTAVIRLVIIVLCRLHCR
jgi:hypothetical protein